MPSPPFNLLKLLFRRYLEFLSRINFIGSETVEFLNLCILKSTSKILLCYIPQRVSFNYCVDDVVLFVYRMAIHNFSDIFTKIIHRLTKLYKPMLWIFMFRTISSISTFFVRNYYRFVPTMKFTNLSTKLNCFFINLCKIDFVIKSIFKNLKLDMGSRVIIE